MLPNPATFALRLLAFAGSREPLRIATTEVEREAIFALRYAVYVDELKNPNRPGVDHARRQIRTPEDDLATSTLFYIGSPGNPAAAVRVRILPPGRIPADLFRRYSLERFGDLKERTICHVGHLVAQPSLRGTAALVALTSNGAERTVREHGVEMMIADCVPGLLASYRRLGLRPYGGRLISDGGKINIPLMGLSADLEHLRRCGSPWYPKLRRLASEGKLPKRDFRPLLEPLADGGGIVSEPGAVGAAIEQACVRKPASFLGQLSEKTRARLARGGNIFDVEAGAPIYGEGWVDRDLFVVLEGSVELRRGGVRVFELRAGEVVGEEAFFRSSGQRSGALFATTRARLLHLRSGVLRRLVASHPAEGTALYAALGQSIAERLVAQSSKCGGASGPTLTLAA